MKTSQEITELAKALSKCQGNIQGAVKNEKNPFFKSSYADLSSVWEACRYHLSSNGLSVVQVPTEIEGKICLVTRLCHDSGQWIEGKFPLPQGKGDAQSMGSAISYLRRYALASMVGICQVDDDAEAAMNREPKEMAADEVRKKFKEVTLDFPDSDIRRYLEYATSKSGKNEIFFMKRWIQSPEAGIDFFNRALKDLNFSELSEEKAS